MIAKSWPRWAEMPEFHELPEGWSISPITDHIDIIAGQSPPSDTYNRKGEGMPFLQGCTEFGDEKPEIKFWCSSPSKIAPTNSTLMSVRAPVGELNRADQDYAIGRGLAALIAKEIDSEFLYYGLHRWRQSFQRLGQGTTFEAITARQIRQVIVALPNDVNEQRRIAAVLNLTDDAIAKAKAELDAARNLKRSLMDDVFENGLEKNVKKKPYKIHRNYTASVPIHWVTEPLGKSLQLVEYGTNAPSNEYQAGYPVIAIPQVVAPHLTLSDVPYAEINEIEAVALRLKADDVLLIRTNGNPEYIGKSTIVSEEVAGIHTIFASYLIRVRTKQEMLLGSYLNYFLASPLGRRQAGAVANTSAGNNNIGARSIKQFRFPRPPKEEQKKIVDLLDGVEEQIITLSAKVTAHQDVKKSLLQNLLTGKIRIPEGVLNV